jgi:hypothetical protein
MTMRTNASISNVFYVLYILGICLLLFGFMFLVPQEYRGNVAWLDFVVVCVLFSVNFPFIATLRLRGATFSEKIPGLAILLWADPIFCLLALGVIYWGFISHAGFRIQLVSQLVLLFSSSVVVAIGWMASKHVSEVASEEEMTGASLKNLKMAISRCEVAMVGQEPTWNHEYELFRKLKEDARYLSPSVEPATISHEEEMVVLLQEICRLLDSNDPIRLKSDLHSLIAKCGTLMVLRRQAAIYKEN